MKKIILLVAMAFVVTASFAQTSTELAKQKIEQNAIHKKLLSLKPTKSAKKQAKELKSEGWTVPAGEGSIEEQITKSQLYGAELTTDEHGNATNRYIQQTAQQTAGSYNAGYAAARSAAQAELAAMIKTELVAVMERKLANSQEDGITAVTLDRFNERSKMIVDQTLTRSIPVLAIYRRLANNNFEVQVRIAFDKKELVARIKNNMKRELEKEGDELLNVVDEAFESKR